LTVKFFFVHLLYMKRLLLSFFILLHFAGNAQKYQPIDSTTIVKTYGNHRINSGFCCYVWQDASFQFHGFELNNGNTWFKLYSSGIQNWVFCQTPCGQGTYAAYTDLFLGYVMNDSLNKKVYFTPTLTANFTPSASDIIYDFLNKNVGDSLALRAIDPHNGPWSFQSMKFQIVNIDSMLFAGKYHKVYSAKNQIAFSYSISVIEGIGSLLGVWNSIFTDFEAKSEVTCFSNKQQAMSVSNCATYTAMTSGQCAPINVVPELEILNFAVKPNPVNNKLYIEGANVEYILITDIVGKTVLDKKTGGESIDVQHLSPGIYVLRFESDNRRYSFKFIRE
jgi:hypothetical protein